MLPGIVESGDPFGGDPCASLAFDTATTNAADMTFDPSAAFKPGYLAARELLSFVRFPEAHAVTSAAEVKESKLNGPFALKADWVAHKSEPGGVQIDLTDPATAFEEMEARLGPGTYVLEEMDTRPHTVELIIGVKRDHSFGPVVLVGAGGIHAELFKDTAVELAPVTPARARAMLARLVSAPLLSGWRGAPAPDVAACAHMIAELSNLADHQAGPGRNRAESGARGTRRRARRGRADHPFGGHVERYERAARGMSMTFLA